MTIERYGIYLAFDRKECTYLGVGQDRIDIIVSRHQGGSKTPLILILLYIQSQQRRLLSSSVDELMYICEITRMLERF
jgi:hypothetical protein